jgi:hypothetical protein
MDQHFATRKCPFSGVFGTKGFNWDGLQRFIAGYQPPTKHCARQERDLRAFAKKAGYKIVGVWKNTKPIRSPLSSRRHIFVTDIQTLFPEGSIDSSTD